MCKEKAFKQYGELKSKYPEYVVMFQVGNFYEMYQQDAQTARDVLGVTLCEQKIGRRHVAVVNFAKHALSNHLARLVKAGCKCVMVEDIVCDHMTNIFCRVFVYELFNLKSKSCTIKFTLRNRAKMACSATFRFIS